MSRQKELDADSNAIQQIEFIGQSKNDDGENLLKLATKATLSILDKFEKSKWERCCKSRKRIHFIYLK